MNRYDVARNVENDDGRVVHVRYDGESHDIPFLTLFPADRNEQFGVPEGAQLTADNVGTGVARQALANYFDKSPDEFSDYVVEPHDNGNMTVRPKATWG